MATAYHGSIADLTNQQIHQNLQQAVQNSNSQLAQLQNALNNQTAQAQAAAQQAQAFYAQPNQMVMYGTLVAQQPRRNAAIYGIDYAIGALPAEPSKPFDMNSFKYKLEWAFHNLITFPIWLLDRAVAVL